MSTGGREFCSNGANRMGNEQVPAERRGAPRVATASLATLSAQLGLSKATISRVLTKAPAAKAIPQSTQDRILQAAERMNYRPNLLARSLRRALRRDPRETEKLARARC